MSGAVIGAACAGILFLIWLIAAVLRSSNTSGGSKGVGTALTLFAEQSLELPTVEEILQFAGEAAEAIFRSQRVVVFTKGAEDGTWESAVRGAEGVSAVQASYSGLFGWFKHNEAIAVAGDLAGDARFGAMRKPMTQFLKAYDIDVAMPLVERGQVLAVVGFQLGHKPGGQERDNMRLFRLGATAACANVRLHREAAHLVSLAQEVDQATAVELALVPEEKEGRLGRVTWAGHYEAAGDAGSDFWAVYPLAQGRTLVMIGDAVGVELAGLMVSAVVKSCADAIMEAIPDNVDTASLMAALNRALYRDTRPAATSCFLAIIDPGQSMVEYVNAGHPIPYVIRFGAEGAELTALPGSGPLLGDEEDGSYSAVQASLSGDDAVIFFTNGVTKQRNPSNKELGDRGLQRIIAQQKQNDAVAMRNNVHAALQQHRQGAASVDDQAMLIVSCRGLANAV